MHVYNTLYVPFDDVFVHLSNLFTISPFLVQRPKELVLTSPFRLNPYLNFLNL